MKIREITIIAWMVLFFVFMLINFLAFSYGHYWDYIGEILLMMFGLSLSGSSLIVLELKKDWRQKNE